MRSLWVCIVLMSLAQVANAQDVVLRHALTGAQRAALSALVARFNAEQHGKGRVVLQDLDSVPARRRLPNMALLDDDDSLRFFESIPRFKPVSTLMKENGLPFDARAFLPQVADAVGDSRKQMQFLPIALSLPVLFYDEAAFATAGIAAAPRTWTGLQDVAEQLIQAGHACPLTSSHFVWIHLETLSAQYSQPAVVPGRRGPRYAFNTLVHSRHLNRMAGWQTRGYFRYFGANHEGEAHFRSGECAMLTGASADYGALRLAGVSVGVAPLPYYDDVRGATPGNVLPDGPSLRILAGKRKSAYRVSARFVAFLMRPQVQRQWVAATGFLPMTPAALDAFDQAGMPRAVVELARSRLAMRVKENARMRAGADRSRVHEVLAAEIASVWKHDRFAEEALDAAMVRANGAAR